MFGSWNSIWTGVIDHALNNLFWALEGVVVELRDFADDDEQQGGVVIAQGGVEVAVESIFVGNMMGRFLWW